MTYEEKVEDWKNMYEKLNDFQVYGKDTDIINLTIGIINNIIELSEETGGMDEEYKEKYENLIVEYKRLYKELDEKESKEVMQLEEIKDTDSGIEILDKLIGNIDKVLESWNEDENKIGGIK